MTVKVYQFVDSPSTDHLSKYNFSKIFRAVDKVPVYVLIKNMYAFKTKKITFFKVNKQNNSPFSFLFFFNET